ncbi:hypothetical protein NDU88_008719 [Pleurodeles waltl]|uniref:Uncharacterized protein n=1 Tax=Pleurodeles waltl TaxID=8319 RepID=A0AAV7NF24_PLEWA|nr:hypothetical protein NDU88_008719 [Pleurodeles waltl]
MKRYTSVKTQYNPLRARLHLCRHEAEAPTVPACSLGLKGTGRAAAPACCSQAGGQLLGLLLTGAGPVPGGGSRPAARRRRGIISASAQKSPRVSATRTAIPAGAVPALCLQELWQLSLPSACKNWGSCPCPPPARTGGAVPALRLQELGELFLPPCLQELGELFLPSACKNKRSSFFPLPARTAGTPPPACKNQRASPAAVKRRWSVQSPRRSRTVREAAAGPSSGAVPVLLLSGTRWGDQALLPAGAARTLPAAELEEHSLLLSGPVEEWLAPAEKQLLTLVGTVWRYRGRGKFQELLKEHFYLLLEDALLGSVNGVVGSSIGGAVKVDNLEKQFGH